MLLVWLHQNDAAPCGFGSGSATLIVNIVLICGQPHPTPKKKKLPDGKRTESFFVVTHPKSRNIELADDLYRCITKCVYIDHGRRNAVSQLDRAKQYCIIDDSLLERKRSPGPNTDTLGSNTESPVPDTDTPGSNTESPVPDTDSLVPDIGSDTDSPEPDADSPEPDADSPEPDTKSPKLDTGTNFPEPDAESPEPETKSPELDTGTNFLRPDTDSPGPGTNSPEPDTELPEPDTNARGPDTEFLEDQGTAYVAKAQDLL
jgi:hypothetical protein